MSKFSLRTARNLVILVVGIWFLARFLLPVVLPFLLAVPLALAAEPLVGFLNKRLKCPRGAASAVGVTVALAITVLLTVTLVALLLRQVGSLAGALPDLEAAVVNGLNALEQWVMTLAEKAPEGIRSVVDHSVSNLFSNSSALLDRLTEKLLTLATAVLKGLPDSALSLGTWVLASFMISARLPKIRQFLATRTPEVWRQQYLPQLKGIRSSLGGWLLAQLKLVFVTFVILTTGFAVLGIPYPLLWASLTCLVDILPILGTGTVLIPWSLVCFLQGNTLLGVGLLGIYAAVTLLRSVLEPRLLGKQLGLDPLTTLLALYAGYRIWGLMGMILGPILAAFVTQILISPKKMR